MRICCTICGERFFGNDIISSAVCGHVFHNHCLLQWLENSKSCPQCRHKTTEKNISRLYLDVLPADDDSQVDPETLQHTVDSLKFQVVEKEQLLIRFKEENEVFKHQTKGLREECLMLEKKVKEKDTVLLAYKDQSKYLNDLVKKVSKSEVEATKAKSQLKLYQHIDDIVQGNAENIDEIISANYNTANSQESIKSLATINSFLTSYVTKLKEEKRRHTEEINGLHYKLKELKKNLFYLESNVKDLEKEKTIMTEDYKSLERDYASLNNKMSRLKEAITSPSADVKNSYLNRCLAESPAPFTSKKSGSQNIEIDLTPEVTKTVSKIPNKLVDSDSSLQKNSPYLQLKETSINPANYLRPVQNAGRSSIFKSGKSLLNAKSGPSKVPQECFFPDDDVGYDGLGGHHKVDYFPRPNANKLYPVKRKHKQVHVVMNNGNKNLLIKDYFKNTFSD